MSCENKFLPVYRISGVFLKGDLTHVHSLYPPIGGANTILGVMVD